MRFCGLTLVGTTFLGPLCGRLLLLGSIRVHVLEGKRLSPIKSAWSIEATVPTFVLLRYAWMDVTILIRTFFKNDDNSETSVIKLR